MKRCPWLPDNKPDYTHYHDTEWGVPVHDDRTHFKMLILEGAQAGLSWYSVLTRREGYRAVFHNFDAARVATMPDDELESALLNGNIIRNRLKVFSAKKNAIAFLEIQAEYGTFDAYIRTFIPNAPVINRPATLADIPVSSPASEAISKDLKKRGMSFVGPVIIYAYLQAVGWVNDHTIDCFKAP